LTFFFACSFFSLVVHPATWFKVEFGDGKVVTFRPSALQPLDENGQPLASYVVKPSISKASKHGSERSPAISGIKQTGKSRWHMFVCLFSYLFSLSPLTKVKEGRNIDRFPKSDYYFPSPTSSVAGGGGGGFRQASSSHHPFSSSDKKVLLSVTDPDTWIGRKVYIIGSGKFNGIPAVVKSSGNGWVQIDSPLGELAKRAYELEVVVDDSDFPSSFSSYHEGSSRGERGSSVGSSYYEKQKAIISRKRPRGDSDLSTSSIASSNALSCYRPVNARRSSSSFNGNGSNNYGDYFNHGFPSSFDIPQPPQQRWRSFSEIEEQRLSELEEERNRLPLRDANTLNHQRMHIMRYVTQFQERNRNRPNLGEWKKKINSSLSSYGGKRDEDILALLEHNHHHHHGHHNVCEVCALEKWSKNGLTYCWNEFCPVSPVYYKIIGMLPKTLLSSSAAGGDSLSDKENDEFATDKEEDEGTLLKRQRTVVDAPVETATSATEQSLPSISAKQAEEKEEDDDETPSVFALPPPVVPIQNPNNSDLTVSTFTKRSPSQQALIEMKDYQRDRSESLAAVTDQEDQSPYYHHDKDLDKIVVMNQAYQQLAAQKNLQQQQQHEGQQLPSVSAFSFYPQQHSQLSEQGQQLLPPHYFAQHPTASLNPFLSPRQFSADQQR
jgi:hypothetical protein